MANSIIFNSLFLFIFLAFTGTFLKAQTEGEYYIQSALGGKTLDVQWGKSTPGTPLQIWEYNGTTAQKFTLKNAGGGYFFIKSGLGPYVHVAGDSKSTKTPVTLGNFKTSDNFMWKIKSAGSGYYTIVNKKMNMYLDVQWGSSKNGTPVWMWTYSGTGAQKWKLNSTTAKNPNTIPLEVSYPIIRPPSNPPAQINQGLWTIVFDAALKKVRIRINNFTPKDFEFTADNTYRWVKPNDSELVIPDDKSPYRKTFNIEPFRVEPLTIYIHDMKLSTARTSHENGKVKITFKFEEEGIEIRTNCIDNFGCGGIGNPNFNFEDPVIEVLFKPIVKNGKITYDKADVRFSGHLSHVGVNVGVSLLEAIADLLNFDIDGELSKKGSKILEDYLNHPDIIRVITEKINNNINPASLSAFNVPSQITDVSIDREGTLWIYGQ